MPQNSHKKTPIFISIIIAVAAVLLLCAVFAGAFFGMALVLHPSGTVKYADSDYIVSLDIGDKDDITILNLTDIQLCDLEDIGHFGTIKAEITELVERANPDLITVTGDLTWSNENNISIHFLIKCLDGFGIPWAPVIGNHDLGNGYNSATASGDYLVSLLENSEYCLFRHGPRELGIGNYIVKIMKGSSLFKVLYFMDNGYAEEISEAQKLWLSDNASAITAECGTAGAALFMHKPIDEYFSAYVSYANGREDVHALGEVYTNCSLSGVDSNMVFPILKEIGIKDVVVGHQHTNAFTIEYDGVRLTFGVKTGELAFYYDDGSVNLNGGTVLRMTKDETDIQKLLVESGKYHIDGSDNMYY